MSAILLVLLLLAPAAWAQSKVDTWIAKGEAAREAGKPGKAMRMADKATKHAPGDARGYFLRALIWADLVQLVPDETAEAFALAMVQDCQAVVDLAPDGSGAELCGRFLAEMQEEPALVVNPAPQCSVEANQAAAKAEQLFAARAWPQALEAYDLALERCPDNHVIWTYSGDALYAMGEADKARARYRRAIELQPCFQVAHRFLADLRVEVGDLKGAWESLTAAVACDPTYDAGWGDLITLQSELGRPDVVRLVPLAPAPQGSEHAVPINNLLFAYAMGRFPESLVQGLGDEVLKDIDRSTPVGAREVAAQLALAGWESMRADGIAFPAEHDAYWGHLAAARDAGLLTEALYLHFLDEALAPGFAEHRRSQHEALKTYVRTLVAPGGAGVQNIGG